MTDRQTEIDQRLLAGDWCFADLSRWDGRLRHLEREIRELVATGQTATGDAGSAAWYGFGAFAGRGFKERLCAIVGWHREPPGYVAPELPQPERTATGDLVTVKASDPALVQGLVLLNRAQRAATDAVGPLGDFSRWKEDALRTSRAYDLAYRKLYELLAG